MKRMLIFTGVFLFISSLVIIVSAMLPMIGENKENLSGAFFQESFGLIVTNPWETVQNLIETRNPLFIVLEVVAVFYSLIAAMRWTSKKKEGWEVDKRQQSHGSARLAKPNEIFTNEEFIAGSREQIYKELKTSLSMKEDEK
ncbi:hypothetical protein [Jeotgalibacillus soli]|uniref:Uncharacterized protein n=1 Tax=Jeotgalibacillus soli TaxID=889306 RepID=A0A0C2VL35_9BACL|nr:hypothetical protein [Jeotgalibacillus soli]KIL45166.1 hypothetical protein KP78_27100 [Jeotgalibacillus soli]